MKRHSLRARQRIQIARKQSRRLVIESLEDRSLMAAVASGLDVHAVKPVAHSALVAMQKTAPTRSIRAAVLADDAYENNDTAATAFNLGLVAAPRTISGLVMADSADWYKFTTNKVGTADDKISINFLHSQGDLDLTLHSAAGAQLRISNTVSNTETVSLKGLAAGTYLIRAYGFSGKTNPAYSISVNVTPGTSTPSVADDTYEDNDTLPTARDLGNLPAAVTISTLVMADGHDWYKFSMSGAGTSSDFVAVYSTSTQGNLDLEIYTPDFTRIAVSNGATNTEQISLANRAAGTYYVHVLGKNNATTPTYSLQIDPAAVPIKTPTPPKAPTPPTTPTTPTTPGGGGGTTPSAFNIQFRFAGLSSSQIAVFQQAAAKWQSVITGDLPNATFGGVAVDDLLIDASGVAIDGPGNVLGQAGPDAFRTGSQLPYHGQMEFDTADLVALQANGTLLSVILHEMGHVLGIGTLWIPKGLLAGANTNNPIFVGAQATAAYNSIFGTNATGVPVENMGGPGTALGHWRESVLTNELMTGFLGPGTVNPLSRITIGSLADIGYTVNFAAADVYLLAGALTASPNATAPTGSPMIASRATTSALTAPLVLPLASRYRGEALLAAMNGETSSTDAAMGNFSRQTREAATDSLFANWDWNSSLRSAGR